MGEKAEGRHRAWHWLRLYQSDGHWENDGSDAHDVKISVKQLDFYYGAKRALAGISMDIAAQEITALIGPSGCGKSTFLRCLDRMNDTIPGTRVVGQILLDGQDIYAPG